jgi:CBS domain containing-hemolysin-like protein
MTSLLILYLLLALVVSFLCSVMESVLLSTPVSYLYAKQDSGKKRATLLMTMKENIDRPLAAILSLNTIAHTIGAAGVGAQATKLFGEIYFGVISAILTILILVFSEIIPKTIGARYWRRLALTSGMIIRGMIVITYPLVLMAGYLSRILSRDQGELTVSREEISAMAHLGTEEGIFEEKENRIIQNLIRLRRVKVSEIMTPRVVVTLADEEMSLEEFLKNKEFLYFSRIPVYSGNPDSITGYVLRQGVFEQLAEKKHALKLKDIRREILFVHENMSLLSLWEMLLKKKEHIALVVDEYGGLAGVATMEDIIETILGLEIVDESDRITDMQQFAQKKWKDRQAKYNILVDNQSDQSKISRDTDRPE